MATLGFFLVLLLVSSALGIAACTRRGVRGVTSWVLGAAIVCTAALGVWRFVQLRSLRASTEARLRRDLEAFVRPARVISSDPLRVRLTWTVPCEAFSDSARREICDQGATAGATVREEIAKRFAGAIEIGLTPAQRMIREGDDSLLHYAIREYGSSLRTRPAALKQRASMTIEADARPERHGRTSPPFIAAESAEFRVTLPAGCAHVPCALTAASMLAGGQWFCAERVFRLGNERTFISRLAACNMPSHGNR